LIEVEVHFVCMLVTTGKEIPQQEEKNWLSHKKSKVPFGSQTNERVPAPT
jgi:hypothetical protein